MASDRPSLMRTVTIGYAAAIAYFAVTYLGGVGVAALAGAANPWRTGGLGPFAGIFITFLVTPYALAWKERRDRQSS